MQDYIRICDVEKYYGNESNVTKAVDLLQRQCQNNVLLNCQRIQQIIVLEHKTQIVFPKVRQCVFRQLRAQTLLETFTELNHTMKATILMVTHDAFSASY